MKPPGRAFMAMAAALLGVSPLGAQEVDDVIELEPFVGTATRFEDSAENIPVNLDLITADAIAESGASDVVEVLQKEAGVYFRSTTGNASDAEADLRGFGENSGSRVLVLVDGVKLNRPDIGALNWLQIPLEQIESIEVLRGAQTALYGNNATGGVIKINTKRGYGEPGGNIAAQVGSYGLANVRGGYGGTVGKLSIVANGDYYQINGFRDNSKLVAKSGSASVDYALSERLNLRGSFNYTDTNSLFPGGLTLSQAQNNPRQSLNTPDNSYSDEQIWRFDGQASFAIESDNHVELTAGYLRRDLDWFLAGPGADNTIQTITVSPRQILEWTDWKLVYGLDYIRDDLDFTVFQNNSRAAATGYGKLTRDSVGGYGHIQYEPDSDWTLSAGLRLEGTWLEGTNTDLQPPIDNFNSSKDDLGFAVDLGAVYRINPDLHVWTRFDRLYRYPATDEIAAYQGYPLSQPFNFSLDPETGYNVELGLDWAKDGFFAGANLFGMWLDGEIAFDYLQNLNVNIGDSRRLGADLTLGYGNDLWSLRADYSVIDGNYTSGLYEGRAIWLVPRQRLGLRGQFNVTDKLSFVARYSYTAEQVQGNDVNGTLPKLPSYQLVDLLLRYEIRQWAEVFAGVDNIFDAEYFTVAYAGVYYPSPGRTFKIGTRLSF